MTTEIEVMRPVSGSDTSEAMLYIRNKLNLEQGQPITERDALRVYMLAYRDGVQSVQKDKDT